MYPLLEHMGALTKYQPLTRLCKFAMHSVRLAWTTGEHTATTFLISFQLLSN